MLREPAIPAYKRRRLAKAERTKQPPLVAQTMDLASGVSREEMARFGATIKAQAIRAVMDAIERGRL